MIKNLTFKPDFPFTSLPGSAALRAVMRPQSRRVIFETLGFHPRKELNLCLIGLIFLSLSRPPSTKFSK